MPLGPGYARLWSSAAGRRRSAGAAPRRCGRRTLAGRGSPCGRQGRPQRRAAEPRTGQPEGLHADGPRHYRPSLLASRAASRAGCSGAREPRTRQPEGLHAVLLLWRHLGDVLRGAAQRRTGPPSPNAGNSQLTAAPPVIGLPCSTWQEPGACLCRSPPSPHRRAGHAAQAESSPQAGSGACGCCARCALPAARHPGGPGVGPRLKRRVAAAARAAPPSERGEHRPAPLAVLLAPGQAPQVPARAPPARLPHASPAAPWLRTCQCQTL